MKRFYLFWFALDCGCTPEGTLDDGNAESCDVTNGNCECHNGYTGSKCDDCSPGFYDDPSNTTTTLSCTGIIILFDQS